MLTKRLTAGDLIARAGLDPAAVCDAHEAAEIMHTTTASISRWALAGHLPVVAQAPAPNGVLRLFDRRALLVIARRRAAAFAVLSWTNTAALDGVAA